MQRRSIGALIGRWLPNTLSGRMALLVAVGLIAMQLPGFLLFSHQRVQFDQERATRLVIERSLDLLAIAQPGMLEGQDPRLLAARGFALLGTAHGVPNDARLHRDLLAAAPAGSQLAQQVLASRIAVYREHDYLTARLQLPDGQVVTFRQNTRPPGPPPGMAGPPGLRLPWPVVFDFLARSAVVMLLALWAVRWLSRPLTALSAAAERIGRNLQTPPLAETGPSEVRHAARAFNQMQARLKRVMDEQTRILAAVSHDLKTPLTRLRLRAENVDDEAQRDKIVRDLTEMEAMLDATLDFLRGESWREATVPVDINALLAALADDATATSDGRVTLSGQARQPYPAQPLALKRCVENLLHNGLKYGGGKVEIMVVDSTHRLQIILRDHGPGVPEAMREQVFEPFYRLDSSRNRDTGGTGLGLSIARSIARAHGGDVALANGELGLVATLWLPR
ncbi:hypothetical protein GCM10007860_33790 [Chitiniphilus shinanonensis]|uniref:histidine kinase n=1 Tax=Chitiniphilus shinanonensis TaxID=553088 RepID=A0ABQ6BWX8_9NEIS|nr:ATP-binding protein [Chitiniphilus shinanonensis]GLS06209.1 hypothetical protein GCM10007860_33790 [Chitiniphilus shinanonensis]